MQMNVILALWAHPRSLSTALERIFIERGDFTVMHEPFSAVYYLHEQRAEAAHARFGLDEPADYHSIRQGILQAAEQQAVCFKDMCYHCHDHLVDDEPFLQRMTNLFVVRDPRKAIASHYAMNPQVTCEEIGYEKQASIFRKLTSLTGTPPAVVVAEDLQQNPAGVVRALSDRLAIEDRPDALNWQAGERTEWDNWKQWHSDAAQSSTIQPDRKEYAETVDNHPGLASFYEHHRPFYDEMQQHRIVPGDSPSS